MRERDRDRVCGIRLDGHILEAVDAGQRELHLCLVGVAHPRDGLFDLVRRVFLHRETRLSRYQHQRARRPGNVQRAHLVPAPRHTLDRDGIGRSIDLRLDSKLIVEQLHGRWKVKDPKMQVLWREARQLLAGFERWSATHEPRATNKAADALANLALDDPAAAAALEARYRA